MRYLKKFEGTVVSLFNQRMGDKLWVKFDSTHEPFETSPGVFVGSLEFNGMKDFRNHHKKITPTQNQIDKATGLFKSNIEGVEVIKYYPEYRQIYFKMWDDKRRYTYGEYGKLNKTQVILDFYDDDWIFISLCVDGAYPENSESHYVCDDLIGLNQWLIDHKKEIE